MTCCCSLAHTVHPSIGALSANCSGPHHCPGTWPWITCRRAALSWRTQPASTDAAHALAQARATLLTSPIVSTCRLSSLSRQVLLRCGAATRIARTAWPYTPQSALQRSRPATGARGSTTGSTTRAASTISRGLMRCRRRTASQRRGTYAELGCRQVRRRLRMPPANGRATWFDMHHVTFIASVYTTHEPRSLLSDL